MEMRDLRLMELTMNRIETDQTHFVCLSTAHFSVSVTKKEHNATAKRTKQRQEGYKILV